jgi:geranylgeranyl pyrophosphate synthase
MRAFHDADLPGAAYRRQLRLFSRIALETGQGQALDIAQSQTPLERACEKTLLREYHWKTAAYTFEGPMLSGAILAGAAEPVLSALSRYALSLGQAYQLQNDLLDLSRPAHEGCDLVQGKRTVTLVRARAAMGADQRQSFDQRLALLPSANGEAVGIAEELRRELLQLGAVRHTRALINEFLDHARAAAGDEALAPSLRTGLHTLLDTLEQQYFAPVG